MSGGDVISLQEMRAAMLPPVVQDIFHHQSSQFYVLLPGAADLSLSEGIANHDIEAIADVMRRISADPKHVPVRVIEDVSGKAREIMVDARYWGDDVRGRAMRAFQAMAAPLRQSVSLNDVFEQAYQTESGAVREVLLAVSGELRRKYDFTTNVNLEGPAPKMS